jgi:SH3 domain protein
VKNLLPFLILLLVSWAANAEIVYVTDNVKLTLRSGPNLKNKIVKMLSSGTPLTVLERDPSGYIKVQTPKGTEGYILSRHIKKSRSSRWFLKRANIIMKRLQNENKKLKAEQGTSHDKQSDETPDDLALSKQKDQISQELANLKHTAANALQIKQQRDKLQERVVNAERELQQLKREKQTLEDSTDQTWFIYGGILAFAGIFLGLLIPKISWGRRSSGWDTF